MSSLKNATRMVGDVETSAIQDFSKIKNKETGRVFENPVLEFFARSSPTITVVNCGIIIALFVWMNTRFDGMQGLGAGLGIFAVGVLSWTLFEYLMHRYIFHFISENKAVMKFHHIMHGFHHEYPRDDDHMFMPPIMQWLISLIYLGIFTLILGSYGFVFSAGFVMGYLLYTMTHWATHQIKPPTPLKGIWKHHALHHYKYPNHAFGVSSPLWDYVFGTMPPKSAREDKAQA